ncbi:MAG: hypothetical protein ACLFVO_07695 [Chloroflexaceae bacterium]
MSEANQDHTAFCSCSQGTEAALPEKGQRVRVILLKDVDSWEGKTRTVTPAGTVYEGLVAEIDADGFFDIVTDAGQEKGFYAKDSTLFIDILVAERAVV